MYEVSRPGRPRMLQGGVTLDHKVMHSSSCVSSVHAVSTEDDDTYVELLATCTSYYV